jgi:hypothetical protein
LKGKNTLTPFKIILILFVVIFVLGHYGVGHANESKDMILVLDTSLSMVGYGGKNIFDQVKSSLSRFIDKLEEGDSITFMSFDTEVKIYPRVVVNDANDKEILKKYLSVVEAKGAWTYTMEMIKNVLRTAQELETKEKERQKVIVILTDALDDPPPHQRKHKFNIKEIASAYGGKDWFIFLVNLGDLKKNKRLVEVQKEFEKSVSPYTKIIDAEKSPEKGIEKDLKKHIESSVEEKRLRERSFLASPYFIGIVVIVIVLLVLFYLKRLSELKVRGKLEYWNHELLDPYIENFDLTRQNVKTVPIGKGIGCLLNIRDIEISEPFKIEAEREKGKIQYSVVGGEGYTIDFVNREPGEFIQDGDMFKVSNYTFKYLSG